MNAKKRDDIQRRAIDESRISIEDLAEAAGKSRGSIERYRLDTENRVQMPSDVARRLATFFRHHAKKLEKIADDLDRLED